ncbi:MULTISPECIES: BON domain-containing protein [Pseudoalteromonas]|uniref:BON domain-containing protein n=1 Tax=Pseudoalteromonas TaxID=53246 RepID=UPI0015F8DB30|nr:MULTISPECIES: BON domain-containing protein [unclassified Pseudoalteromonas]MBB1275730.1 BON domain-containing protein [Pseudoalteromonas sp. SR43-3]MBB1279712.1 BON domain-containing protein [Pseudoalteromonas sp. SR41-1]MBB1296397.1 BON domain-containing protein [Pseudoalteromonas sp. SR41-7]MBB1305568.1 BON domain-containing protein [Pseudoalteromonas sp. SR43-5]MBB1355241.1 BON domain-containing protein [Pseudoalteromonas sp. SR45-5]
MKTFNKSIIAALVLGTTAMGAQANSWENESKDAWIDGKAETVLLMNTNLNNFDINTDVKNGKVVLTGKVNSELDKELAEELVLSLDGVTDVDNSLTVVKSMDTEDKNNDMMDDDDNDLTDAKITTVITTRFLFDSEVGGTDIDVDTDNGVVTLNGSVESEAEKQLAVKIAKNAEDVRDVVDKLAIVAE